MYNCPMDSCCWEVFVEWMKKRCIPQLRISLYSSSGCLSWSPCVPWESAAWPFVAVFFHSGNGTSFFFGPHFPAVLSGPHEGESTHRNACHDIFVCARAPQVLHCDRSANVIAQTWTIAASRAPPPFCSFVVSLAITTSISGGRSAHCVPGIMQGPCQAASTLILTVTLWA